MENAIYLHLLAEGYRVYVGKLRAGEVDFVATKGERPLYVKVASEEIIKREFGNLAGIRIAIPDSLSQWIR